MDRNSELHEHGEENKWMMGGGQRTTSLLLTSTGKIRHIREMHVSAPKINSFTQLSVVHGLENVDV
jgi:hypothetical protein